MEARKNKNAIIVGIFIVIAIVILLVAVFTLGGEQKTFTKKFPLKVVFNDINGLKEGNNIWFSGVKIGTVKRIRLNGFSNVEVTLNLEEKARPFIHQDATAKITSDGLLGNKIVVIYGGTANLPAVETNGFIGIHKVGLDEDMFGLLNASNKNLLDITNNLKSISNKLNSEEGTLGKLINDSSMANSLETTLNNLKTFSDHSKNVIADIEVFTEKMNTEGSSINKLFTDSTMFDSIKTSVAQIKQVAATVNDFANNINDFAKNIKTASSGLQDSSTMAGMLLNNKKMTVHLESTIKNLESASKKLDEDLEAVQHNFLFRGYFRKKQRNSPVITDSMQNR